MMRFDCLALVYPCCSVIDRDHVPETPFPALSGGIPCLCYREEGHPGEHDCTHYHYSSGA